MSADRVSYVAEPMCTVQQRWLGTQLDWRELKLINCLSPYLSRYPRNAQLGTIDAQRPLIVIPNSASFTRLSAHREAADVALDVAPAQVMQADMTGMPQGNHATFKLEFRHQHPWMDGFWGCYT